MSENASVSLERTENFIDLPLPKFSFWKYHFKFLFYQSQVKIFFENSDYIVKTVESRSELHSVFELRYKMFLEDLKSNMDTNEMDLDRYDNQCDHIVIVDKSTHRIIGTYRMICSKFFNEFYSENEFTINRFLNLPGIKLELGRACIHPNYRNGQTIDLLWKGIWEYIYKTNTRYLFGCSSIDTESTDQVYDLIYNLKEAGHHSNDLNISPRGKYKTYEPSKPSNQTLSEFKRMLPPLLRGYLNAGAKVHGNPAWDKEFECMDLFTILDLHSVNPKFKKRYAPKV